MAKWTHHTQVLDQVVAADTNILSTSITPRRRSSKLQVTVTIDEAAKFGYTIGGGSIIYLAKGANLVADAEYTWDIPVVQANVVNFHHQGSTGTTVRKLHVDEYVED